jgi:hypothetical protein
MDNTKFENMIEEFGDVQNGDVQLALKQHPYVDLSYDDFERYDYFASAVDLEGNEYEVIWEIKSCHYNDIDELQLPEDESEACDWTKYRVKSI